MPTYSEKLRDPRWQRKRLEVLEAAQFMCRECNAADKTLHVHHGYYRRGAAPWEYEDETLHVLCEDCHESTQDFLAEIHQKIAPLDNYELALLYDVLSALQNEGIEAFATRVVPTSPVLRAVPR